MKVCFREMKCDECQKFFRQKSFLTCTYSSAKENIIYSTKISKYSERDQIIQTIFNLKGDWDAEKVIDIPNKKVILKTAK